MKRFKRRLFCTALFLVSIITLTGCPGSGDRLRPDEETTAIKVGDNICFSVSDAEDYQPADIAINPRGTPSREEKITFSPALTVTDGQLCIPSSFYTFPDNGKFIVSYILVSQKHTDEPRRMVAGLEILHGRVSKMQLTDMEILRPYDEMNKSETTGLTSF